MDVSLFMAEKAVKIEKTEFVVSDRFVDANGKAIPWVLYPVSPAKEKDIKKRSIRKDGTFDNVGYTESIAAETVLEPNLADASLQDSYHTLDKVSLLEAMLTSGEMNKLQLKALSVNGLDKPLTETVEEVKN